MIELLFFLLLFALCAAFDYAVFKIRDRRSARVSTLSRCMSNEKDPSEFLARISLYPPAAYPELYPDMRFSERYFLTAPSLRFHCPSDLTAEEFGAAVERRKPLFKMVTEDGGAREESRSEQ